MHALLDDSRRLRLESGDAVLKAPFLVVVPRVPSLKVGEYWRNGKADLAKRLS
jgi:hypothetical protein